MSCCYYITECRYDECRHADCRGADKRVCQPLHILSARKCPIAIFNEEKEKYSCANIIFAECNVDILLSIRLHFSKLPKFLCKILHFYNLVKYALFFS
jgi:hypothetical protein